MRTLHLLRHAKSSWGEPSLADHDRPLAPRGQEAAAAMHAHLARIGFEVDLVLVSSARRAQQTWELVAPGLVARAVRTEPRIYDASQEDLLRLVRRLDDTVRSVLLVGHDPGFHQLAISLAGAGDEDALTALHSKYPTGALASFTFDVDWSAIGPRAGRLVSFVRPRDLAR